MTDSDEITSLAPTSSVVDETAGVEGCEACDPPDNSDEWRDIIAYYSESRDAVVVAPKEHTMEVRQSVVEQMLTAAEELVSADAFLRFQSLDLPDHFHAYVLQPPVTRRDYR